MEKLCEIYNSNIASGRHVSLGRVKAVQTLQDWCLVRPRWCFISPMGNSHVCQVRIQSAHGTGSSTSPVQERVKISTVEFAEINSRCHRAMDNPHKFYVSDIALGGHVSDESQLSTRIC